MKITRIALAGGPMAGKTTCFSALQKQVRRDLDDCMVIFLPEAATFCFKHRKEELFVFDHPYIRQHYLMCSQLLLENAAQACAEAVDMKELILITDRGILDAEAYVGIENVPLVFGSEIDETHYDLVLYLTGTAGNGDGSTLRIEKDPEETAALAQRTGYAWHKAEHVLDVGYRPDVRGKIDEVADEIERFVGKPLFSRGSR